MNEDFEFLVEKEEMWARMLMEVLQNNDIPCATLPVYGAGLSMKIGVQERFKIYVPKENKSQSEELLKEIFSESKE